MTKEGNFWFLCTRKFYHLPESYGLGLGGWFFENEIGISQRLPYFYWSPKFHRGRNTIRNKNKRGFLSTLFVEVLLRTEEKHSYWIVLLLSLTELAFACFGLKCYFTAVVSRLCRTRWFKNIKYETYILVIILLHRHNYFLTYINIKQIDCDIVT